MYIHNSKIITKPEYISIIISINANKILTIKNTNTIQLESYRLEKGEIYINNKIKMNEGIALITSSSDLTKSNFDIYQDTCIIDGGIDSENIISITINQNGSLSMNNSGELLYKLSNDYKWSKLKSSVFTDIIDIESSHDKFYIISKSNGVFNSRDLKTWTSDKELLDTNISFIKNKHKSFFEKLNNII